MKKTEEKPPYMTRSSWVNYDWWESDIYKEDFKSHMRELRERIISHPNGTIFNRI